MQFNYKKSKLGDPMLAIKTNQHLDIELLFDKGDDPTHIYINGNEFTSYDEVLYGLFVGVGEKMYSLRELCLEASFAYPDFRNQNDREASEAAAHEREMSCPRATDRI